MGKTKTMPRKKKGARKDAPTYYKAKNGRFYKKVQIDGKTRVRFVSNAEASGSISTRPKPKSKSRARRKEPNTIPIVAASSEPEQHDDKKLNEE